MQAPFPSGLGPDPELLRLTERVQAEFTERGQTLTDPATAAAFRTTLDVVRMIHEGALATGVVDAEQHATLNGMIDSVALAPDVL